MIRRFIGVNMELTLKEIEVTKLNLQPGDVLTVTIKDNDIDTSSLESLREMFKRLYPNNEVALFGIGLNSDITFTVTKGSNPGYCVDCSCGKKEQVENG